MIDFEVIEKSKRTCEEIKTFFVNQNLLDCVIEISDKKINDWVIHYANSDEKMMLIRSELSSSKKSFICIYERGGDRYFFFTDYIITKLEITNTKEIIFFDIEDPNEFNLKLVMQEFSALKKAFQNA